MYMGWVQVTLEETFVNVTPLNTYLLDVFFEKSTIGLHSLLIPYMLAIYQHVWRSISISSICKILTLCINGKQHQIVTNFGTHAMNITNM